jgi:hypothetical protein
MRQLDHVVLDFPNLFADKLGMVEGILCENELPDKVPV